MTTKDALELILKTFNEYDTSLLILNELAENKQIISFLITNDWKISFEFKLKRIAYLRLHM